MDLFGLFKKSQKSGYTESDTSSATLGVSFEDTVVEDLEELFKRVIELEKQVKQLKEDT